MTTESTESLTVEFLDDSFEVADSLTFGRNADLVVDDANSYMHRIVGSFDRRNDTFWLTNCGSSIRIRLTGSDGLRADLPSGTTTALTAPAGVVAFEAGPATYEIGYRLPGVAADVAVDTAATDAGGSRSTDGVLGTGTKQFGVVLTPREIDFMVEFARPALVGHGSAPTYADVAAKYGVSEKTVDNTLQTLRRKLKESGVRGVTSLDTLVDHLVSTSKITLEQLAERDAR